MSRIEAQSLSVKRAQVEFHKFASLGDFEHVVRTYAEENHRRRGILLKHREFIGPLSPFLEIGANAGHTSYMLANEFGADGFALDLRRTPCATAPCSKMCGGSHGRLSAWRATPCTCPSGTVPSG